MNGRRVARDRMVKMKVDENGNWRAFRHRNFRILFAANSFANVGTWAQRIAQDWLVLELTNSGTALGVVTALQFVPVLFLSLHGGVLGDRFDKRKVLFFTNLGGWFSSGLLGLLVITDHVQIWHVYALAFSLGASSAIDAPVRNAFSAEVVGHADIGNAVSLNSANFNAARIVGPAASGALIAAFGTGPSFIINSFTFLIVIYSLVRLRKDEFFLVPKSQGVGNVREGIRYVRARPDLYVTMIVIFFMATFGLNFQIFNALSATQTFQRGAVSFGLLGTFLAFGSLSGAIISARLEKRRSTMFIVYGAFVFGATVMVLAFMPTYFSYALWLPFCGFAALTTAISANGLVQSHTDPGLRGRVMGIYHLVFLGGAPAGSTLVGLSAEKIGVQFTIGVCGFITSLAAAFVWVKYRHKVETPESFAIDFVLPPGYENKS